MFMLVLQNYYYQTMFAFPDFELSPPSFPQIIEIFFKEDGNPDDAVQLVLPGQNALEISLRFLQRTIHNIIQVNMLNSIHSNTVGPKRNYLGVIPLKWLGCRNMSYKTSLGCIGGDWKRDLPLLDVHVGWASAGRAPTTESAHPSAQSYHHSRSTPLDPGASQLWHCQSE